jgi:hypothetical protein
MAQSTEFALAVRGFSKLSAGLAGQDDGVSRSGFEPDNVIEGHSIARDSLVRFRQSFVVSLVSTEFRFAVK